MNKQAIYELYTLARFKFVDGDTHKVTDLKQYSPHQMGREEGH